MKRAGAIIAGLLVAAIGQLLGLGLAGAGHGWIAPLFASLVLWAAYPLTFGRALDVFIIGRRGVRSEPGLLLAAAASDALLLWLTRREGVEYFWRVITIYGWATIAPWMTIWLGWQLLVLLTLIRAAGPSSP